jgi:hypothetical protein
MNRQMKRTVYEAPITECFHVEMEGAFCSASADVENTSNENTGRIDEHEVNTNFTGGDFSEETWG